MVFKEDENNLVVTLGFISNGKAIERYFKSIEDTGLEPHISYGEQLHRRFRCEGLKVSAKYMYLSIEELLGGHDTAGGKSVNVYFNGNFFLGGVGTFDEFEKTITFYDIESKKCVKHHFNNDLWDEFVVIQE